MKTVLITLLSAVLTAAVLSNAYIQKKQFYPSVVYITKSNPSMAVLYLQALVMVILMGKAFRKVFFGTLRAAEVEHLIERSWYAVTETCLAFTVFRDDFNPKFVAMFTLLLFLKSFHWLGEDRVDYMERSPIITLIFHVRIIALMFTLAAIDMYFVHTAYHSTLMKGASVQLVFGFEYAILYTSVLTTLVKYILHSIDMYGENPWDNKAVYLLYTELIMGFLKVFLYVSFTLIMIKVHTFPLFAIRPLYLSIRNFKKALQDVIMSRRAIHNMNTLYPDVTPEELQQDNQDNVCIICREEMVNASKRLPCNHIFHTTCLRSWFQRQQTCPTCRMDVLRAPPPAPPAATPPAPPAAGATPPAPPATGTQQAQPQQQGPGGAQFQPFLLRDLMAQLGTVPGAMPGMGAPGAAPMPGVGVAGAAPMPGVRMPGIPPTVGGGMMMPPLPMPFIPMPFTVPFPAPHIPPTLTDGEVRQLEGEERRAVEARVRCLRNIHTLLDAALIQMEQYTSSVMSLPSSRYTPRTPGTPGTGEGGGEEDADAEEEGPLSSNELRRRRLNKLVTDTTQPVPGGSGLATASSGLDAGGSGLAAGGSGLDAGGSGLAAGGSGLAAGGSGLDAGGSGLAAGGSGLAARGSGLATKPIEIDKTEEDKQQ